MKKRFADLQKTESTKTLGRSDPRASSFRDSSCGKAAEVGWVRRRQGEREKETKKTNGTYTRGTSRVWASEKRVRTFIQSLSATSGSLGIAKVLRGLRRGKSREREIKYWLCFYSSLRSLWAARVPRNTQEPRGDQKETRENERESCLLSSVSLPLAFRFRDYFITNPLLKEHALTVGRFSEGNLFLLPNLSFFPLFPSLLLSVFCVYSVKFLDSWAFTWV